MASGDEPDRSDDVSRWTALEGAIAKRLVPDVIRRQFALKFLSLLLLFVVIVAAMGAVSYVQVRQSSEASAERTLRSSATVQADNVADWLASMRTHVRAASLSDALASGGERRRGLDALLAGASTDIRAYHYVDPATGRILASTDRTVEGERVATVSPGLATLVTAAANDADGDVIVSESAYERRGHSLMGLAARVQDDDGVVVAVTNVRAEVMLLHRERAVVKTRVLTAEGLNVLSPRLNTPVRAADTDAFRRAMAGKTTVWSTSEQVHAFAPVANSQWVVQTIAPKNELYAPSRTIGRNVVALVATVFVAVGVVALVLARQTILPLTDLRRRVEAMESGNLDVPLRSDRRDEIGRLYDGLASMRDTLREQIEAATRAREAAERSRRDLQRQNERLEEFASTVSHDLRNPLTVARGSVAILEEDLAAGETDRADLRATASRAEDALDRMETIIEEVLELARGGIDVEAVRQLALESIARQAWETVDTEAAHLRVEASRQIEADPDRLQRALENLFRNAVEHAGPGVTVTVTGTDAGFVVSDDGPGVPPGDAADVFSYGYTTREGGTGLGLSIVQAIAEAHGWSVSLDQDRAEGACFVFEDVPSPDDDR